MDKYCVILIYNKDKSKILMCHRIKKPYMGLKNFVGGKIEKGESAVEAAYREMTEETGITKDDISLQHIMSSTYIKMEYVLEIFAGQLKRDVKVYGDENPLHWIDAGENFFDTAKYAGDGNLGHIIITADKCKNDLYG